MFLEEKKSTFNMEVLFMTIKTTQMHLILWMILRNIETNGLLKANYLLNVPTLQLKPWKVSRRPRITSIFFV